MGKLTAALMLLIATMLTACGGSDSGSPPPPPAVTATGTATVDASGGTVASVDGVSVTVPANALAAPTTVRIARDATGAPPFDSSIPAGDIYALTPHGSTFTQPVDVRLPIPAALRDAAAGTLSIAKAEVGASGWTLLDDVRRDGDTLATSVTSFSYFIVIGPKTLSTVTPPAPFTAAVEITACGPGTLTSPTRCVTDAFTTVSVRATTAGEVLAPCARDVRATLVVAPQVGPNVEWERARPYAGTAITAATGSDGVTRLAPTSWTVDNISLGSVLGRDRAVFGVRVECRTAGGVEVARNFHGAQVDFRHPREVAGVNGVPYILLQWIRQPTAPVGVEGQPLTLAGVLAGGRSLGASAAWPQRRPTPQDTATIDWERSDDNGLSWHIVGRSFEFEANPSPLPDQVAWDYWGTGYGLPKVTRADANALFRGRACYPLPVDYWPGCVLSDTFRLTVAPEGGVPSITSITSSQLVREGQTASFTAVAAGLPAPTLQWRQRAPGSNDFVDIAGATGTTFTTAPTTLAMNGTRYQVVATNGFGTSTSTEVTLSVSATDVAPTILTQPAPLAVIAGSEAVFAVDARGTEALSYAWRKGGVPIGGASGAVLKLAAVSANDAGVYSVVVSNGAGSVTSSSAALTVTPGAPGATAPTVVTQPANVTATRGSTATFGVGVAGTGPFSYQWRRNGSAIAGATAAVYTLASVADADAGAYDVAVSNGAGSVTSSAATLTVTPGAAAATAPSIATQPSSLAVFPGTAATFAVAANGSGPLAYQWSRNGTPLPGATGAVLTLTGVTGADAGTYTVSVANAAGSVASSGATLVVVGAPVITAQPGSPTVTEGQTATFVVGATGDAVRYQWTRNNVAIDGATSAILTTGALALGDSGASYGVVVYNGAGLVFSQKGAVTVTAAPAPSVPAVTLSAGWRHTCAVLTDDGSACWGYNSSGQIGSGNFVDQRSPVRWSPPGTVVSVAAGERGSCAVLSSGSVFCSGAAVPGGSFNTPVEMTGLGTVRQVVIGSAHACALARAGTVKCWGNNGTGQLGDGTNTSSSAPVDVLNSFGALQTGIVELEAGDSFTCGRFASGGVVCWGESAGVIAGQPGNAWWRAQDFPGLSGVTSLAAGELHLCARRNDGTVLCSGSNLYGQLGNGSTSSSLTTIPTAVPGLADVAAISGGSLHLCARMNDGTVQCWGTASMGNGGVSQTQTTPAVVRNLSGVVALAAGFEHTCALRNTGQLLCWGAGGAGQLGLGDTAPRTVPTAMTGTWMLP